MLVKRDQLIQKNAIMRISMLSRVGASGGVLGSSNALCPRKRARPSVSDSYVLSSSTFCGDIFGKYHQRCEAAWRITKISPSRSRYRNAILTISSCAADVTSHIAKGFSSTHLFSGFQRL